MEFDEFIPVPAKKFTSTDVPTEKVNQRLHKWVAKHTQNIYDYWIGRAIPTVLILILLSGSVGIVIITIKGYPEAVAEQVVLVIQDKLESAIKAEELTLSHDRETITLAIKNSTITVTEDNMNDLAIFLTDNAILDPRDAVKIKQHGKYLAIRNGKLMTKRKKNNEIEEISKAEAALRSTN